MTRLVFFGIVDFLASLGNVCAAFKLIHYVELKSPDNISRIFNAARFFETLEGNGLVVIGAIKGADDDESGVGVALEFFEFANSIVNAEFNIVFVMRNNLKIVDANDRSFTAFCAERTKEVEQVVSRFVLKFENL